MPLAPPISQLNKATHAPEGSVTVESIKEHMECIGPFGKAHEQGFRVPT